MSEGYSVAAVEAALENILPIETGYGEVTETLTLDDVYVSGDEASVIYIHDSREEPAGLVMELLKNSLTRDLSGTSAILNGNTITLLRQQPDPARSLD